LDVLQHELKMKRDLIKEAENSIKYFIELKSGTVSNNFNLIKLFKNILLLINLYSSPSLLLEISSK